MNSQASMDLYRGQLLGMTKEEIMEEMEKTKWRRNLLLFIKDWRLYLMLLPAILFFFTFRYLPILSIIVGFKNKGEIMTSSTWDVFYRYDFYGFHYINQIMFGNQANEFWRAFRNTFALSMYGLIFGFPIPIFLALFFSEIKSNIYRSITQVITYLPNFLSTVITTTIILVMLAKGSVGLYGNGVLAEIFYKFGLDPNMVIMENASYFRQVYIISGIWEGAGYGSIVYYAAIMSISPTNYEAARIDGANKWAQIRYVTLPGMAPTLTIMLIMRIGSILNIGFEKVLLLTGQGADCVETAEVISTYVYRKINDGATQVASVADLFNSFTAMCLVLGANFISRRVSETSLF